MKTIRILVAIEMIIILLLAILGYNTKNTNYVFISPFLTIFFLLVLFYAMNWKKKRVFQFLTGNFILKGDSADDSIYIYGRFTSWVKLISQYIGFLPLFVILIYVNDLNGESLLIISLSLISVGIALSILTFGYAHAIRVPQDYPSIFDGARRFYLATIFTVFFLVFVVLLKFLTPFSPNMVDYNLLSYIICYAKGIGVGVSIFGCMLALPLSIRFFIEGFILVLKGMVDFDI